MTSPAFAPELSFTRILTDCGRVIAGVWAPVALAILVLGVAPVVVCSLPWWRGTPDTSSDAFRRIFVEVTIAKNAVKLIAYSAVSVCVSAASWKVLCRENWRDALQGRVLTAGFAVALCLNLLANWQTLLGPLVGFVAPFRLLGWLVVAGGLTSYVLTVTCLGVALPASIVERLGLGAAMARSFGLLRGQRWRMLALCAAYLLLIALGEWAVALGLSLARVDYVALGPGRAAIGMAPILVGALGQVMQFSVFLQARRIADGPSAGELHDVFG